MKNLILFALISVLSVGRVAVANPDFRFIQSILQKFWRHLNYKSERILSTASRGIIFEDAVLTTPELVRKYGYPIEIHTVETADGYLVDMHRIPKPGGIPVYLLHGITDSSGGWVIMGPEKGLAYLLADQGYDVWMGNARGTRYSRKHKTLNPNSRKFWDFSFHEIGIYDVPACIDHILNTTGFSKLQYIGFSQGTTSFWIMCSQRPEYCDKIILMQALAPVAYMRHTKSPVILTCSILVDEIEYLTTMTGTAEFLPNSAFLTLAGQILCRDEAVTQAICSNILFLIGGYNTDQLNTTSLPVVFGHIPAGSATKQYIHYGQFQNSALFRQYDYGFMKNLMKYGKTKPPLYNLKNVTAPVVLHYSTNDWLTVPVDVNRLADELPNLQERHLVSDPTFTHLDFMFAIDVKTLVYDGVIARMRAAENIKNRKIKA